MRAFHSQTSKVCRDGAQEVHKPGATGSKPEPPGPEDCCQVSSYWGTCFQSPGFNWYSGRYQAVLPGGSRGVLIKQ